MSRFPQALVTLLLGEWTSSVDGWVILILFFVWPLVQMLSLTTAPPALGLCWLMFSYFPCCYDQTLGRSNLREERYILAHVSESVFYHDR